MRILHLTPQMGAGGAERQLANLVTYLKHYPDVEQHIAIIYPETIYPFFFRDDVRGIPVSFLNKPVGKLGRVTMAYRYWRLIRRFQPDIVHAHQWYAMDLARVFHRKLRLMPAPRILAQTQNMVLQEGRLDNEKRLFRYADRIATVSPESFEQYRTLISEAESRLVMIPNGVDTEKYTPGSRTESERLVLFPARLVPAKNHIGMLQAVKALVDAGKWPESARILCVGDGDDAGHAQHVMEIWRRCQLTEQVQFRPAVHDILSYYRACDFVLLPSLFEGLPLTLLEAAACARPALVSDATNASGVIVDGDSGWIVPANDPTALAEGLLRALNTPPHERKQMGRAAYQRVIARYSMTHIAAQYYTLYHDLQRSTR